MAGFVFRSKLVICCFGVLLLFLPICGASAGTDTDWSILLRASAPNYANPSPTLRVGTQWNAMDGYDTDIDIPYPSSPLYPINVASHMPAGQQSLFSVNMMSPLTGPGVREWNVRIWAGTGYANEYICLAWWSTSTWTPPSSLNGYPASYILTVHNDPTGTFAPGTQWNLSPGSTGTSTSPCSVFYFSNLPGGYIELGFAATIVPEPCSILVLASGVAGLGGVIWRRRGNK